jgi:SAM-dependent methyltransferase
VDELRVTYAVGSVENIPNDDNCFDAAVCIARNSLDVLLSKRAFTEVKRVLKLGGLYVFTIMPEDFETAWRCAKNHFAFVDRYGVLNTKGSLIYPHDGHHVRETVLTVDTGERIEHHRALVAPDQIMFVCSNVPFRESLAAFQIPSRENYHERVQTLDLPDGITASLPMAKARP